MNMTDMPPIAAVAFLLLAGCASSQPDRHGPGNQFDTNGDGNLSRTEYAESSLSDVIEFEALDTDGDELLSPSELEFHMGRGGKERRNRGAKGGRLLIVGEIWRSESWPDDQTGGTAESCAISSINSEVLTECHLNFECEE